MPNTVALPSLGISEISIKLTYRALGGGVWNWGGGIWNWGGGVWNGVGGIPPFPLLL